MIPKDRLQTEIVPAASEKKSRFRIAAQAAIRLAESLWKKPDKRAAAIVEPPVKPAEPKAKEPDPLKNTAGDLSATSADLKREVKQLQRITRILYHEVDELTLMMAKIEAMHQAIPRAFLTPGFLYRGVDNKLLTVVEVVAKKPSWWSRWLKKVRIRSSKQ